MEKKYGICLSCGLITGSPHTYCEVCGGKVTIKCPHCELGEITDKNAKFCRVCGKQLVTIAK